MTTQEQLDILTKRDYTEQSALWAIIYNSSQYLCNESGSTFDPLEDETWEKTFINDNGEEDYENVKSIPQGNYDVMVGGAYLSGITI